MARRGNEVILGYPVVASDQEILLDDIVSWINAGDRCRWLACINLHSYAATLDDIEFTDALHGADWLIPDGSGIVLASYLLGGNIRQRITGSDIFSALNFRVNELGGFSVFFLG